MADEVQIVFRMVNGDRLTATRTKDDVDGFLNVLQNGSEPWLQVDDDVYLRADKIVSWSRHDVSDPGVTL